MLAQCVPMFNTNEANKRTPIDTQNAAWNMLTPDGDMGPSTEWSNGPGVQGWPDIWVVPHADEETK